MEIMLPELPKIPYDELNEVQPPDPELLKKLQQCFDEIRESKIQEANERGYKHY